MPRSPRPPKPSPRASAPAPGPAPPQPMVAPSAAAGGGGGGDEEEFEVRNCNGFVFRRPLLPDAPDPAAPSAAEAGAGPEAARGERRRRRALFGLLKRYRRELSQWEALERDLLAPLPASPPPEAAPASPRPAAAVSFSASVLDDLIAQAEVQEEWYKKITEFCDETDALNRTEEEAMVDAITALPVWRDPRELMASLCTPDELSPGDDNQDKGNGGFQRLDSQQGKSAMEARSSMTCKEAVAASSVALERTKNSGEDRKEGPDQRTRCSHFGHTEKTCRNNHSQLGDEVSPPVVAENRKRKEVASPICSNSVAGQPTNKSKRTKASGSTPTPPGAQSAVACRSMTNNKKEGSFYTAKSSRHIL